MCVWWLLYHRHLCKGYKDERVSDGCCTIDICVMVGCICIADVVADSCASSPLNPSLQSQSCTQLDQMTTTLPSHAKTSPPPPSSPSKTPAMVVVPDPLLPATVTDLNRQESRSTKPKGNLFLPLQAVNKMRWRLCVG